LAPHRWKNVWFAVLAQGVGTAFFDNTIGNPLNWRNVTNMEWHQRSLTSMTLSNETAVSFQLLRSVIKPIYI